ncbi:Ig-like domain-containing protein, partial [Aeromonas jandaei]|uniref:Ig-like domain-containing protein n=1 Tax=Aeromonas jandaei TaxID=650 RepID=UPI003BA23BB2
VDTTFVADATTATLAAGDLTVTTNNAVANGEATNAVRALVRDANGNPVSGVEVAFAASNGAALSAANVTTGDDGVAVVTLTNTAAGVAQVTATVGDVSQRVDTTFVAGAPATAGSTLTAGTASIVAGGAGSVITLTLRDANNNPVTGQTVTFASTLAGGNFTTVQANADGTYTSTFTGTTVGTASITARVGGNAFAVTAVNVTVTAGAPVAAQSTLVANPTSIVADGRSTSTITL